MAWSCVTILSLHTDEMVDGDEDHDDDDDDDDGNDDYSGSPFMMAVPNMEQPLPHICICSQKQQNSSSGSNSENAFSIETKHRNTHFARIRMKLQTAQLFNTLNQTKGNSANKAGVLLHVIWCITFYTCDQQQFVVYLLRLMNLLLINIGLAQFSRRNHLCRWNWSNGQVSECCTTLW